MLRPFEHSSSKTATYDLLIAGAFACAKSNLRVEGLGVLSTHNGNSYNIIGLYWGCIAIMEKIMETTSLKQCPSTP